MSGLLLLLLPFAAADPPAGGDPPALDPAVSSVDEATRPARKAKKDVALVVGNTDYASLPDATYADRDARAVHTWLTSGGGLRPENATLLLDAKTAELAGAVQAAAARAPAGGTLWLYFAGHGATGGRGQRLLLGTDASGDPAGLAGVSVQWLTSTLEASPADRAVVVLDAGFGGFGRAGEELYPFTRFVVERDPAPPPPGVVVGFAAGGAEAAGVLPEAGHGVYTWLFLGAARGWADGPGGDGLVGLDEVLPWVAAATRRIAGPGQAPAVHGVLAGLGGLSWKAGEHSPPDAELARLAAAARARRVAAAQEALYRRARVEWQVVTGLLSSPTAPLEQRRTALRTFLSRYDDATVVVDGQELAVLVAEAAQARKALDELERAAAPVSSKKTRKTKPPPAPPPPPPPTPSADAKACGDLEALLPLAAEGRLGADKAACVGRRIEAEDSQTTRDKLSRVLLVDAEARGDDAAWMALAARHLERIDRSDPDLCYKYALRLSRGEVEDAGEALRWAEIALENKSRWVGPTFVARLYALYRIRAESAERLWAEAEAEAVATPAEADPDQLAVLRGQTRDYAREWLQYASASGQPTERPRQLCESAAATVSACAE